MCQTARMRLSVFVELVESEFGAVYAGSLLRSHVLGPLDNRTAREALDAGVDPRTVWFALCEDLDVPLERRWGKEPPGRGRSRT